MKYLGSKDAHLDGMTFAARKFDTSRILHGVIICNEICINESRPRRLTGHDHLTTH